jgi:hypothetical protein
VIKPDWYDYRYYLEVGNNYGTCLGGTSGANFCPSGYDIHYPYSYRYWADTNGNGYQIVHFIEDYTIADYYQHGFEIQRNPNNICNYFVYVDGIYSGTSRVQYCPGGYSYGYEVDTGLEHNYPARDPNFYSDTVSNEQLQTWHGAWYSWEYQYSYNGDEPCVPILVNCFNGTNDGSPTIWRTNRPWQYG